MSDSDQSPHDVHHTFNCSQKNKVNTNGLTEVASHINVKLPAQFG